MNKELNYKAITAESLTKTSELIELSKKKVDTLEELRLSLIYHAIKHGVCELDAREKLKLPIGARCVWPNGDTLLLDYDTFMRVGGFTHTRELSCAPHVRVVGIKKKWNECFSN